MIGFGKNTNISSAKYVPYLYDRIKSIVLSFTNSSVLSSDVDSILIPCDNDGSNPVYTNTSNTFRVFYGGINQTSNWTIDVLSETNVTTSQTDNTISITDITADTANIIVRAIRPDYSTITKTIYVFKSREGATGPTGATGLQGSKGDKGDPIVWLGGFTSAPSSPNINDAYYNSTIGRSYVWDGSIWSQMTQDGSSTVDATSVNGTTVILDPSNKISVNNNRYQATQDSWFMLPESEPDTLAESGDVHANVTLVSNPFVGGFNEANNEVGAANKINNNIIVGNYSFSHPTASIASPVSFYKNTFVGGGVYDITSGIGALSMTLPQDTELTSHFESPIETGLLGTAVADYSYRKFPKYSTCIGNLASPGNSGDTAIGIKGNLIGKLSIYASTNTTLSTDYTQRRSQKILSNAVTWTNAVIRGTVNKTFTASESLKNLSVNDAWFGGDGADALDLTPIALEKFSGVTDHELKSFLQIKLVGTDLVTGDNFYGEYKVIIDQSTIKHSSEQTKVEEGTLIGSTIVFTTASNTIIPTITSSSSNPCKWAATVEGIVITMSQTS